MLTESHCSFASTNGPTYLFSLAHSRSCSLYFFPVFIHFYVITRIVSGDRLGFVCFVLTIAVKMETGK